MRRASRSFLLFCLLTGAAGAEVTIDLAVDDDPLEANLLAHLRLAGEACDAPDWRVRRLYRGAELDLDRALRAFGYYRPTIGKQWQRDDDCWQAVFTVDPGRRTHVRQRSVVVNGEAAADPDLQRLLAGLPLAEGEPLNHATYEQIKSRLRGFAMEHGYLDFAFTRQQLRVDPNEAEAEIDIVAESGPRYRFGELRFSQNPLSDELIHKLAGTGEGELYGRGSLTAIDRNLSDTGYFRQVEVRPRRAEARDGVVPVDVRLDTAARHAWRAGVGYSTDTLWRLSLGYDNRYLNADGHRLESELRLGPVESGLKVDYLAPGRDPLRENFSVGARLLHEETTSAESDSVSLIARQVIKEDGWTQTRFLELLHEQSEVGADETRDTLLMPGIGFDRWDADSLVRPDRGYRLAFEVKGAYEGIVSTATLLQMRATAKAVRRLGDSGRLIGRVAGGATIGDSTSDLPASLRFFAGGDNSVRGYAYESLGPVDANGEPVGGRHLLTGSIEYEQAVHDDDWWLAGFVDAGNAFNGSDVDARVGYGFGVRWYSPIGRVRLDLAFPEDDDAEDDWRIHFGLGTEL